MDEEKLKALKEKMDEFSLAIMECAAGLEPGEYGQHYDIDDVGEGGKVSRRVYGVKITIKDRELY